MVNNNIKSTQTASGVHFDKNSLVATHSKKEKPKINEKYKLKFSIDTHTNV